MYCDNHHSDVARDILESLPKSQKCSTGGRHKCAACAYSAGIIEGLRRAQAEIDKLRQRLDDSRT